MLVDCIDAVLVTMACIARVYCPAISTVPTMPPTAVIVNTPREVAQVVCGVVINDRTVVGMLAMRTVMGPSAMEYAVSITPVTPTVAAVEAVRVTKHRGIAMVVGRADAKAFLIARASLTRAAFVTWL